MSPTRSWPAVHRRRTPGSPVKSCKDEKDPSATWSASTRRRPLSPGGRPRRFKKAFTLPARSSTPEPQLKNWLDSSPIRTRPLTHDPVEDTRTQESRATPQAEPWLSLRTQDPDQRQFRSSRLRRRPRRDQKRHEPCADRRGQESLSEPGPPPPGIQRAIR